MFDAKFCNLMKGVEKKVSKSSLVTTTNEISNLPFALTMHTNNLASVTMLYPAIFDILYRQQFVHIHQASIQTISPFLSHHQMYQEMLMYAVQYLRPLSMLLIHCQNEIAHAQQSVKHR